MGRHTSSLDSFYYRPDGTMNTAAERAVARRAADRAAKAEALANPPPKPDPAPVLSRDQREAARQAEAAGREAAKSKTPATEPRNPYRDRVEELRPMLSIRPELRKRMEANIRFAQEWDQKRREEKAAAELQTKRESDPLYKNAMEHADAFARTVSAEEQESAAYARGLLSEGDVDGYWRTVREAEQRQWAREDAALQALNESTAASLADYGQQAAKVQASADRLKALPAVEN